MSRNDELIIDLTNYRSQFSDHVMKGRYRVVVDHAEKDNQNDKDLVRVWLRIVDGGFEGATLVERLYLTSASMFRMVNFMQAIGLPTPHKILKMNLRTFIGKTLEIDVEDGDPYKGTVRSEVKGFMRAVGTPESGEVADLPDESELPGEDDLSAFTGEAQAEAEQVSEPEPEPPAEPPANQAAPAASAEADAEVIDLDEIDLG